MAKQPVTLESVTLSALRRARGWTAEKLAQAAGVSTKTASRYEGERSPSPEVLEALVTAMGYEPDAVDTVLHGLEEATGALQEGPSSPIDPTPEERRLLRGTAGRMGRFAFDLIEQHGLRLVREGRARHARSEAARLWEDQLRRTSAAERRRLIETPGFSTWALVERLCHESEEAASDRVDRAIELAELALRAAELAPCGEVWRSRLLGYAWAYLGNALRVRGDLKEAEEAFARAWKLWGVGAPADSGVLAEWRLLDLEASMRRDQRRFYEALARLEHALTAAPPEATGRILLKRAATFDQMGEAERAVETLREAAPLIDEGRDPRLLFGMRFNLAASFCKLRRHAEAENLLPDVRDRAIALRKELDLVRVVWLQAQAAAGLDRRKEAVAAYDQVRREFRAREMAYDYALASLELAVLLLEEGRQPEVKELARRMLWTFRARDVHREALAALSLFCEAAEREEVTAELARRISEYLTKARQDPDLRFEP